MKATYMQRGEALDYTNTTDAVIEANTIIELKERIGVAGTDIIPGQLGDVHVSGVFTIPKKDADAIEMGTTVYYADGGITATSGGTPAGYAAESSAAGASNIAVKIG
jgi:predicted RecA/RadA family phage recombinase